jgi:hypothetical protein
MAAVAAGPHATDDFDERARRQDGLQQAKAAFDPLPFDGETASIDWPSIQFALAATSSSKL